MAKVNQQLLLFVEAKNFFKSDDPVLIHCVDEDKTVDHNYYIENCLKSVAKETNKISKYKLLEDNVRSLTLLII